MGIYGMMRTGVAGMNAQGNRLSTVADNVANSSTVGYKRSEAQFSTLVVPQGRNSYQSGGVNTHVRYDISQQGMSRPTMRPGDVMINGNGFFRVSDSSDGKGANYFTRAGSFERDKEGNLVNASGFYLLEENGTSDPTKPIHIDDTMSEKASTKIDAKINLKSSEKAITGGAIDPEDPATYHQKKSVSIIDEEGNSSSVDIYLTKTADNEWAISAYQDGNLVSPAGSKLTFGADGKLTSAANISLNVAGGNPVSLNLANVTEGGAGYSFSMEADGNMEGAYQGFTFSKEGEVMVTYSNGKTISAGKAAMGTVTAPDQLTVLSGTLFKENGDTGPLKFGTAGKEGFGPLMSGVLEDSNADIGNELTDMIEAQRNYTANSKVFQTGSELMDVIINLKR